MSSHAVPLTGSHVGKQGKKPHARSGRGLLLLRPSRTLTDSHPLCTPFRDGVPSAERSLRAEWEDNTSIRHEDELSDY